MAAGRRKFRWKCLAYLSDLSSPLMKHSFFVDSATGQARTGSTSCNDQCNLLDLRFASRSRQMLWIAALLATGATWPVDDVTDSNTGLRSAQWPTADLASAYHRVATH